MAQPANRFRRCAGTAADPVAGAGDAVQLVAGRYLRQPLLDLFAGSGALGFEAASRGAKLVVQVEDSAGNCKRLRENIARLAAGQIQVVQQDAAAYLAGPAQAFDLVFLDPPFGQGLLESACRLLESQGWLKDYAKIYLESEKNWQTADLPANWGLLKEKVAGEVCYRLLQRQPAAFNSANGLE